MLRTLSAILLLGYHFAFGSGSIEDTHYHKRNYGTDPQAHKRMQCASLCSQNAECKGFIVDDAQCELITSNPDKVCYSAVSACYIKCTSSTFGVRVPCHVSMSSGYRTQEVRVIYQQDQENGIIMKFGNDADIIERVVTNSAFVKTSKFLPLNFGTQVAVDWYYWDDGAFLYSLYDDDTLDIWKHTDNWQKVTATPITFTSEFGSNAPFNVNAADLEESTRKLYLISGDTVYQYDVTGTPPNFSYSLLEVFDFTVNAAQNPFSAGISSALASPPPQPHALWISPSWVIAFSGDSVYSYQRSTGNWQKEGVIPCPC